MAVESQGVDLVQIVALLGAGVVAVPLFKKLKLGSVLGYFAAGLIIGPFGLGLFTNPMHVLHVAEFGVIMLLFVIGLEMEPSRLWRLRRQIFGLGAMQVLTCGGLLALGGWLCGLSFPVAFVAGMGFVLSSTAVVTQMLEERGELGTPAGQKAVSILLLEDLAIVPLLAIVAFMAPSPTATTLAQRGMEIGIALAAIGGLIVVGRWVMNPMFRLLAQANAREVMTAAALLVVLGAALLMEIGGLSMAMGAFLAGVLLSESSFRHQLEADIEPFRGILLGLFFLAIGMALDLAVMAQYWQTILAAVVGYTIVKALGIYFVARRLGSDRRESITRVTLFAQGGEFAFVLYAAALDANVFSSTDNAIFTAVVILSMALTPVLAGLVQRHMPAQSQTLDDVEVAQDLRGTALIIGFGRFAQVVSQSLLARGFKVSIIESDVDMIRTAARFGFKVYYGDGTRLHVLKASGAEHVNAILVCTDTREVTDRIVDLVKHEFPLTKLFVRAYDRGHAMDLIRSGVDYQVRETFESALVFGEAVLRALGVPDDEAAEIAEDVRRRDEERLALQVAGDLTSGRYLVRGNAPVPEPLTAPKQSGEVVDADDGTLGSSQL